MPVKGQDECLCRVWTLVRSWFWLFKTCAALSSDGDVVLGTPTAASPTAVGSGAELGACRPDRALSAVTWGCQLLLLLWAKQLTPSRTSQEDQILPQPFN